MSLLTFPDQCLAPASIVLHLLWALEVSRQYVGCVCMLYKRDTLLARFLWRGNYREMNSNRTQFHAHRMYTEMYCHISLAAEQECVMGCESS